MKFSQQFVLQFRVHNIAIYYFRPTLPDKKPNTQQNGPITVDHQHTKYLLQKLLCEMLLSLDVLYMWVNPSNTYYENMSSLYKVISSRDESLTRVSHLLLHIRLREWSRWEFESKMLLVTTNSQTKCLNLKNRYELSK